MKMPQSPVHTRSAGRRPVVVAGLAAAALIAVALVILTLGGAPSTSAASADEAEQAEAVASALMTRDAHPAIVDPAAASLPTSPYFQGMKFDGPILDAIHFENPKNPGVVLIITDTLRPDHLGAYGSPIDTSPFMDSLAKAGVAFTNHVSNSSWTKTSMASLLTGLYPSRHGVLEVSDRLAPSYVTIAESFRKAGFATGAVIANKIAGSRYGLSQGFDFVAEPKTHFNGESPHAGQALATALRWLSSVGDKPFFLMVLLFDAHDPYYPPSPLRQKFCNDCGNNLITSPQREYHRGKGPSAKQISDMRKLYDGEVRFIDDQLRNFYAVMGTLKLTDRTTFALLSDHGEAFGEHGVFEHAFHMWDEVTRTPLILQGAALRSTGYVVAPTSHIDVAPTLLRLGNIEPPKGVQGQPLVRRTGEKPLDPDRILITEVQMYGIHRTSVRNHTHKMVYHSPLDRATFEHFYKDLAYYPSVGNGEERWELFDLVSDPFEHTNVYDDKKGEASVLVQAIEQYQRTGGLDASNDPVQVSQETMDDLRSLGYVR